MSAAVAGSPPMRYLALGDSYTFGEGVDEDQRWPVQLADLLRARGKAIDPPHIIARSGWTTDELSAAIDSEAGQDRVHPPYDLVSLQIGVNDQYRGRALADFLAGFQPLLSRALEFAGEDPARVFVLSIPDWGVTPFAQASGRDRCQIAEQIDSYNTATSQMCAERAVRWVDITDLTRDPALVSMLVADGLHPSGGMYARWTERLGDVLPD